MSIYNRTHLSMCIHESHWTRYQFSACIIENLGGGARVRPYEARLYNCFSQTQLIIQFKIHNCSVSTSEVSDSGIHIRHFDKFQYIPLCCSALSTLNNKVKVTANTIARMWHCTPPYHPLVLTSRVSQAVYTQRMTQVTKDMFDANENLPYPSTTNTSSAVNWEIFVWLHFRLCTDTYSTSTIRRNIIACCALPWTKNWKRLATLN